MNAFEKSRWIWVSAGEEKDQYAEFNDKITYCGKKTVIRLSCDSDYTLYVNGAYAASNQYGDFEHYKIYDSVDITEYLTQGENEIGILVHYCGVATSRYRPARAGLIYEVLCDGEVILYSREETPSRISPAYVSGAQIMVTSQLGFTFFYDATKRAEGGYTPSVCVEKACTFYPRPIEKAKMLPRRPMKAVTRYSDTHYLIDLGGEVVGVPVLDVISDTEQELTVAWGEHITDGGVRKTIGKRHFYYTYKTVKGRNTFVNYMLRLGCRYLEVFAAEPVELEYAGVLPQVYEVEVLPCRIENELDRRIYDACVNTLKLCMMEHYVDCPWREQALYAFDSRNQMLCGYYAFKDKNDAYARANLMLIGQDRREDGLLSICYPCGTPLAIPSFSLYFLLAVKEYVDHTGDVALAKELLPKMLGICEEFLAHVRDGLLQTLEGEQMWNFYDWSAFSAGTLGKSEEAAPDLVINCLFVIALDCLSWLCAATQTAFPYPHEAELLRQRIRQAFLTSDGVCTMHMGREEYTVLGNSLAILAGIVREHEAETVCDRLINGTLADCSLSMKVLEYAALLQTNTEKYRNFVLDEIRSNYKLMLDADSDTVWETLKGASDFGGAGSLCHGWSAIPVYIYHKLGIAQLL
ncbi:MAG: family 78 glycoside hydrolase catalytic domain [Clostridia bacterium]|nr:family 78 glycoside hydrolase catalytic domain [Clostridia bacterium]